MEYKHVVKRFKIDRNFEDHPDTDIGHRSFYEDFLSTLLETEKEIQDTCFYETDYDDFPIFSDRQVVTSWVGEVIELPKKVYTTFGVLLLFHNCVKFKAVGTDFVDDINYEDAARLINAEIIEFQSVIEQLKKRTSDAD